MSSFPAAPLKPRLESTKVRQWLCDELTANELYFTKTRAFFSTHIVPVIYRRTQNKVNLDSASLWPAFAKELARLVVAEPGHFVRSFRFPFMRSLLSYDYLLRENDVPDSLVWMNSNGYRFIDTAYGTGIENAFLGHSVPVSTLANAADLEKEARENCVQFRQEDVLLSLMDLYDPVTGRFTEGWKERLQTRKDKQAGLLTQYLDVLSDAVSPSALRRYDKSKAAQGVSDAKQWTAMTLPRWKRLVEKVVTGRFVDDHTISSKVALNLLYRVLQDRHAITRGMGACASELQRYLQPMSTRVYLTPSMMKDALQAGVDKHYANLDAKTGLGKQLLSQWPSHIHHHPRLKRLPLANKTRDLYQRCFLPEALLHYSSQGHGVTLYELHVAFIGTGVSQKTLRTLIQALFLNPAIDVSPGREVHDLACSTLPAVLRFADRMRRSGWTGKGAEQINNKLVKLLASWLAGGGFEAAPLDNVRFHRHLPDKIAVADFHSLDAYIALDEEARDANRSTTTIATVNKLQDKGVIIDDGDVKRCLRGRLSGALSRYAGGITRKVPGSNREPVHERVGRLTVSLYPHNHLTGILGASVPGVCIPFGSRFHYEHLKADCLNLIVEDEERIHLWGLVVACEIHPADGRPVSGWLLNNFQGRLPSRHRQARAGVVAKVQDILGELPGPVCVKDLLFNALSVAQGLTEVTDLKLVTRPMRLDLAAVHGLDKKGEWARDDFFVIGHESLNKKIGF